MSAAPLSIPQVYALARQAGFGPTQAVTMTAIAIAESGLRPDALGDVDLTQRGERSVGLWQINYRPSRDGGNATRDPQRNLDPLTNARHAYEISGGGSNFRPWSTYTNGAYTRSLAAVSKALGGKDPVATSGSGHDVNVGGTQFDVIPTKAAAPSAVGGTTTSSSAAASAGDFSADDSNGCPGPPLNPLAMPAWVLEYSACMIGKGFAQLRNDALKALLYTVAVGTGATVVVLGLKRTVDPVMQRAQQVAAPIAGAALGGPAGAAAGAQLGEAL